MGSARLHQGPSPWVAHTACERRFLSHIAPSPVHIPLWRPSPHPGRSLLAPFGKVQAGESAAARLHRCPTSPQRRYLQPTNANPPAMEPHGTIPAAANEQSLSLRHHTTNGTWRPWAGGGVSEAMCFPPPWEHMWAIGTWVWMLQRAGDPEGGPRTLCPPSCFAILLMHPRSPFTSVIPPPHPPAPFP